MDEKDFEIAAQLEQMERDSAIAKVRHRAIRASPPPEFDGSCTCGADIPPGRIAAGYWVCVDCVAEEELRNRLRA